MTFEPTGSAPEADFSSKTFLIVDDFQGMRTILRDILRSCGANAKNISTAGHGTEAINLLSSTRFDVVLCDFNLGEGKNGQQILEEAKVRQLVGPACAWIMVTAEKTADAVSGAAEFQPDTYLLKPITETILRQRLARIWAKKEAFTEIDRAVRAGNHAKAIALCDQRLAFDKANFTDLLRTKCDLLLASGDLARARQTYETVLASRQIPWAKVGVAKILLQTGDPAKARTLLEEVLRDNGAYLEAHDLLAKALQALGEFEAAGQALERAVRLSPNSVVRQKNFGEMALKLGQLDHAERAFRKSVTLGEHSVLKTPDAYLGLAKTCSAKESPEEALRVLGELGKRFDGETVQLQAMAVEGIVHHQSGNPEKAQQIAEELGRKLADGNTKTDSQGTLEVARLLLATGNKESAVALLQNEVQNSPDNAALLTEVKEIFTHAEMGEEGAQLVEASRAEAVEMMNRGVMLVRNGQHDEAIAAMRMAREAMPKNVRVLFNLVYVLIAKLQNGAGTLDDMLLAEARASLDAAQQLAPGEARHAQLSASLNALTRTAGA
ncbi:MAG: response regulator [Candidatus Accumulibacter sp. 66-26]|nr:tetratricopeptide repeat protein [Accumulibacter sp.]OJW48125.1 MAG: response regulator [Candidatus Accumulibacter sp. 66-26]